MLVVVLGKVLLKACFSSAFLSMKAAFYHPHVAMMRIMVCVTIQSISVGHCYIFTWCGHIYFEWNEDVLFFFFLMKFYFYFLFYSCFLTLWLLFQPHQHHLDFEYINLQECVCDSFMKHIFLRRPFCSYARTESAVGANTNSQSSARGDSCHFHREMCATGWKLLDGSW